MSAFFTPIPQENSVSRSAQYPSLKPNSCSPTSYHAQLLTDLLPEAYRVQEESPYCAGTAKNFDAFRRVVRGIDQPLV